MRVFRLIAIALCTASLAGSAQTIQVSKENRTISVTASDKITAMADMATVHIGFIAYGPSSDAAYANGSRTSNAIVKALTAAGIPSASIESENQAVAPVQNYQVEKLTDAEKATLAQFKVHARAFEARHLFGERSASVPRFPAEMNAIAKDVQSAQ